MVKEVNSSGGSNGDRIGRWKDGGGGGCEGCSVDSGSSDGCVNGNKWTVVVVMWWT